MHIEHILQTYIGRKMKIFFQNSKNCWNGHGTIEQERPDLYLQASSIFNLQNRIFRVNMKKLTLIVCDVQPDVIKKIPNSKQFVDLVDLAVRACRNSRTATDFDIVHTMIRFPECSYECVPLSHPKLGILRKLQMKNSPINWFTSSELCIPAAENDPKETVVSRTTYLPHSNDSNLLEALRYNNEESLDGRDFVVIGYGPTVQSICYILGDVIGTPNVHILKECVQDENKERCQAFLDFGLMFKEEVASLVDFIECRSFSCLIVLKFSTMVLFWYPLFGITQNSSPFRIRNSDTFIITKRWTYCRSDSMIFLRHKRISLRQRYKSTSVIAIEEDIFHYSCFTCCEIMDTSSGPDSRGSVILQEIVNNIGVPWEGA